MKYLPLQNKNGTWIKNEINYILKDVTNHKITGPKSNEIIDAIDENEAALIAGFTSINETNEPEIEIDLESLKQAKKDYIANERWKAEVAGIEVNGMKILTDFNTQTKITSAYVYAFIDSNFTVDWKTVDGFVTLNAQQIMFIGNAIKDHVQSCFTKEKNLLIQVENALSENELNNIVW